MPFLLLQKRMFRLIGYDLKPHESHLRSLIIAANLILLYTIMWPEMTYVTAHLDNVRNATDGLCPLLFGFSSAARLVTLRLRRRRFYALFTRLQAMWSNAEPDDRDLLQKAYETENRLSFPYIASTCMLGGLYLTFPLVRASYQFFSGQVAVWEIPMRSMCV